MDTPRSIIETRKLTFRIGQTTILKDVNLNVPKGSVYGFLGPNGAGKTTLIRLLLNLYAAEKETIFLFGSDITTSRVEILQRLGRYVEHPSLYQHLSGEENLRLAQKYYKVRAARVDEVLDTVGMKAWRHRKVKAYSLGMRQRIAIGQALLHDPELLILDEPTNGLDPTGIREIRELLLRLNKEHGKTIFISSHLLSEIEKMCTHVGVIHQGEVLYQGTLEGMVNQAASRRVFVQVNNPEHAIRLLAQQGVAAMHTLNSMVEMQVSGNIQVAAINRLLVQEGVDVYDLHQQDQNLEKVFMSLTNRHITN